MKKRNKKKKDAIFDRQRLEADLNKREQINEIAGWLKSIMDKSLDDRSDKISGKNTVANDIPSPLDIGDAEDIRISIMRMEEMGKRKEELFKIAVDDNEFNNVVRIIGEEIFALDGRFDEFSKAVEKDMKKYGMYCHEAVMEVMTIELIDRIISFYKKIKQDDEE